MTYVLLGFDVKCPATYIIAFHLPAALVYTHVHSIMSVAITKCT